MLKKDSWILGITLGILTPLVAYGIMHYTNIFISKEFFSKPPIFSDRTLIVLSIVCNLLTFRYYMVTLKNEYTGRGVLLVTFIFVIAFFILYLD